MLKVSKKIKTIVIPVFNIRFTLIDSKKKYKFIQKHNDVRLPPYDLYGGYLHTAKCDGYLYYIMSLRDKDIQTIVHEATHMAHYVMKHVGITINYKNTEVQAYLVDYIVGRLCKAVVK